jgi:hypothetical protein
MKNIVAILAKVSQHVLVSVVVIAGVYATQNAIYPPHNNNPAMYVLIGHCEKPSTC